MVAEITQFELWKILQFFAKTPSFVGACFQNKAMILIKLKILEFLVGLGFLTSDMSSISITKANFMRIRGGRVKN